ncbi:MBL fold metallo-hydrolase [Clostridium sp.]|uniref:MBL fold metallo-hydrolase n=1 Tax=Clostridium sp. TaxID=1506 RepID=UPI002FCA85B7
MKFCPLFSGSSGNSIFVASDNARVLIDVGMPGKAIENEILNINENPKEIDGIFVTHEHSDHIKGIGVLSRRYDIPIYANELTWKAMFDKVGKIKEHNIKIIDSAFTEIKDITVESFEIAHDAAKPSGYKIHSNKGIACIATDLGHFSNSVKEALKDADIILLESNHDIEMLKFGPYPYPLKRRILSDIGHLSNEACGRAILDILGDKHKFIYLGHLSKTNNYPELAYETVVSVLRENSVQLGKDVTLNMADRDKHSLVVEL